MELCKIHNIIFEGDICQACYLQELNYELKSRVSDLEDELENLDEEKQNKCLKCGHIFKEKETKLKDGYGLIYCKDCFLEYEK
jgi:hypothetical protein